MRLTHACSSGVSPAPPVVQTPVPYLPPTYDTSRLCVFRVHRLHTQLQHPPTLSCRESLFLFFMYTSLLAMPVWALGGWFIGQERLPPRSNGEYIGGRGVGLWDNDKGVESIGSITIKLPTSRWKCVYPGDEIYIRDLTIFLSMTPLRFSLFLFTRKTLDMEISAAATIQR